MYRLVGEYQKLNTTSGKWLGETFGWAYAGDSLVAILAGQLAALTAAKEGPTGPFTLSVLFLSLGSLLALFNWSENVAPKAVTASSSSSSSESGTATADDSNNNNNNNDNSNSISAAISVMSKDPRILLLGAVQALFEGAMYIFVLQWPPAIKVKHYHIEASIRHPTSLCNYDILYLGGNLSQPTVQPVCGCSDCAVRKYLLVLHGLLPAGIHSVRGAAGLGENKSKLAYPVLGYSGIIKTHNSWLQ